MNRRRLRPQVFIASRSSRAFFEVVAAGFLKFDCYVGNQDVCPAPFSSGMTADVKASGRLSGAGSMVRVVTVSQRYGGYR